MCRSHTSERTDLLGWVDRWVKVLQETTLSSGLVVNEDLKCLVRATLLQHNQINSLRLPVELRPARNPHKHCTSKLSQEGNSLDDQGVKRSRLRNLWRWRVLQVLLLPFASDRVTVSEDKMDLIGGAALIGTEHDREGSLRPRQQCPGTISKGYDNRRNH